MIGQNDDVVGRAVLITSVCALFRIDMLLGFQSTFTNMRSSF
jgi:hypothetical protein